MKTQAKYRWYGFGHDGAHAFFIEITKCLDEECWIFNTSLPIILFQQKKIGPLIKSLCNSSISSNIRDVIAQKIIDYLLTVKAIEQYFFDDSVLDRRGFYCEAADNVITEIKMNPTLEKHTPYTSSRNENTFVALKSKFSYKGAIKDSIQISKEKFEAEISLYPTLQDAYTEEFNAQAEYFLDTSTDGTDILELHFMVVNKKLKYIFISKWD